MPRNTVNFSSNDEWYTPVSLVKKFGEFDYDPATTPERAALLGIRAYDTAVSNGLLSDWTQYKRIWINPPFTQKKEFWKKAWETYQQVHNEIYFLCPIDWITTRNFHETALGGVIYLPNRRIKFESIDGEKKKPTFGSVIIKLANDWQVVPIVL